MENNKIAISMEQQFGEIVDIILQHKSRASRAVNNELLSQHGMWAAMYLPN